jgi:hypothetical protein
MDDRPTLAADVVSAEEILFDLFILAHREAVFGSYVLNRKEGRLMSSHRLGDEKQPCESTPVRSVMDFWLLFEGICDVYLRRG